MLEVVGVASAGLLLAFGYADLAAEGPPVEGVVVVCADVLVGRHDGETESEVSDTMEAGQSS